MKKYRIVSNGRQFRVQEKIFGFWISWTSEWGPCEFSSREEAEERIIKHLSQDLKDAMPWVPVAPSGKTVKVVLE